MLKVVCCDLHKFEERVNQALDDGWRPVPDTVKMIGGGISHEKSTGAGGRPDFQREKKAIGYGLIILEK